MARNRTLLDYSLAIWFVAGLQAADTDEAAKARSIASSAGSASITSASTTSAAVEIELLRAQIVQLWSTLETLQRRVEVLASSASPGPQIQGPDQTGPSQPAVRQGSQQALLASVTAQATAVSAGAVPPLQTGNSLQKAPEPQPAEQPKKWYEKYSLRGYTQMRHNRLLQTNDELVCLQCDGTTAANNNFTFRRARFVLSGEITDKISIYFQPDFASTSGNLNFGQIRDLYFDIFLDKKKEFRFRAGQSKVPYSFENLQSSQNRLALDRNDATNSAFPNERDLGIFFYWTPAPIRARFAELISSGLKGSGDYGVLGTGIDNGQLPNMQELNNNLHYSGRATYPWKLKNGQFIEASLQAYTGAFTVATRSPGTQGLPGFRYNDRRVAASFVIYPQPFGFQAEYTYGTGPEYNRVTRFIDQKPLSGGYVQVMYMKRWSNGHILTPFYRFSNFGGGKKHEIDARHYVVRDHELGIEWQPNRALEIVLQYGKGFRIFEDAARPNWQQSGHQLRTQLQINY